MKSALTHSHLKSSLIFLLLLSVAPLLSVQATNYQDTIWVWKDTLLNQWTGNPIDSVGAKAIDEQNVAYDVDYQSTGTPGYQATWKMLPPSFDTTGKTLDSCAFCTRDKTTWTTIGTIDPKAEYYDAEQSLWIDCLTTADTTPNLTSSYANYCWVYGRVGDGSICTDDPPNWGVFYHQAGWIKLIYGVKTLNQIGGTKLATYISWAWLVTYSHSPPAGGNPQPGKIYVNGTKAKIYNNGNKFNIFK